MPFPIGNPIIDTINRVGDAVAPVTSPIRKGFDDAVEKAKSGINAAVEVGGAAVNGGPRRLEEDEIKIAREYFGDSIDYDRVRINESSALAVGNQHLPGNSSSRPFVVGNTINFPSEINLDDPIQRSTFLHEMTHVWQFQSTKGVGTTIEGGRLALQNQNEVYRLDNVTLDPSDPESFHDLTIEQQAEIVRGHFLLSEHQALTDLLKNEPSLYPDQLGAIQSRIADIEKHPRFRELSNHKDSPGGFTAAELDPFIQEIKDTKPREGIVAEANEAVDEITGNVLRGNQIGAYYEVGEGAVEIGREAGEAVINEAAETVGETIDAAESFGDEIARRFIPRPFG